MQRDDYAGAGGTHIGTTGPLNVGVDRYMMAVPCRCTVHASAATTGTATGAAPAHNDHTHWEEGETMATETTAVTKREHTGEEVPVEIRTALERSRMIREAAAHIAAQTWGKG